MGNQQKIPTTNHIIRHYNVERSGKTGLYDVEPSMYLTCSQTGPVPSHHPTVAGCFLYIETVSLRFLSGEINHMGQYMEIVMAISKTSHCHCAR
jgi:hypothetical protein